MADEIIRLDYSAEDIGDNIDEVREARGTFDTLDDRLDNIEGGGPSPSNPIASNCVSPMTGYAKSSSSTPGDISTSDTLNAALGKVEKRVEDNENNILSTCCVGTCTTAGNTAAKIVTIDDPNWVLRKGCIIGVKFTYSNSSSTDNVTLNVNNTGDKSIYFNNNVYTDHSTKVCGTANTYIYYMYDGTYWCWINYGFDSTYSSMSQGEASTGTATTGRLISAKVLSDTIDEKISPLENNILSIIGNGYKNKLYYKSGLVAGYTETIGEVTFTVNADLSITASSGGNAVSANRTLTIYEGAPLHIAGDKIAGGVSSQCSVECELSASPYTNYGYSTGSAGTMTAATGNVTVYCRVKAGAAVNVTFYPMICDAGFYGASDTFEPFKMPNLRLVQDKKIMLKDGSITWRQSSAGLYYTDPIAIEGISNVVSVMLTQFAYLSDSNIIQVIGSPTAHNSVRFIANSDNINASAYVMVTVLGF